MKKLVVIALALCVVIAPVAWSAGTAQVAVTVTITQSISVTVSPGAYDFGSTAALGGTLSTSTSYFTATNDGNSAENLTINVGNSAQWTAGMSAASETFVMEVYDGAVWKAINPSGGVPLASGVTVGVPYNFGLRIILPTQTAAMNAQQSIPVTITASAL